MAILETDFPYTKQQVELTVEDRAAIGMERIRLEDQIIELEAEKKAAVDVYKQKISEVQKQLEQKRNVMRQGYFEQDVPYIPQFSTPTAGMKRLVHAFDDSVVIREEPMTPEDRQIRIPGTGNVVTFEKGNKKEPVQ